MREIDKLKQRLGNIKRGVAEYKMTIDEANSLVTEFENLEKKLQEKPQPTIVAEHKTEIRPFIYDGGNF